jgi:hypothetical protein
MAVSNPFDDDNTADDEHSAAEVSASSNPFDDDYNGDLGAHDDDRNPFEECLSPTTASDGGDGGGKPAQPTQPASAVAPSVPTAPSASSKSKMMGKLAAMSSFASSQVKAGSSKASSALKASAITAGVGRVVHSLGSKLPAKPRGVLHSIYKVQSVHPFFIFACQTACGVLSAAIATPIARLYVIGSRNYWVGSFLDCTDIVRVWSVNGARRLFSFWV